MELYVFVLFDVDIVMKEYVLVEMNFELRIRVEMEFLKKWEVMLTEIVGV